MGICRFIETLNQRIGQLAAYAIWAGMLIMVAEVCMRYIFNAPTVWAQPYAQRLFGSYFVLIGAYTLIQRGHVRVDLLLSDTRPRFTALLDFLNYVVLLIWTTALSYEAWQYFKVSWDFAERDDSALGHPIWPVKLALFIGVSLITLQGISELIRALSRIIQPRIDPSSRQEARIS